MVHKADKENKVEVRSKSASKAVHGTINKQKPELPLSAKVFLITLLESLGGLVKSSGRAFKNFCKIIDSSIKNAKAGMIESHRNIKLNHTLRKSKVLKRDKNSLERKKYFTLMVVPNSSNKVKTIRISRFFTKLAIVLVLCAMIFSIYLYSYISSVITENDILKTGMDKLYVMASEHELILSEKLEEINTLIEEENSSSVDVNEYADKFKDIMENYVTGRINSGLASRSTSASASSIASDIEELNNILIAISEINDQKEKRLIDLTELEEILSEYLDSLPTLWPVSGRITSGFGSRNDPITSRKAYHKGIDIAASYGTSIKASASGKVTLSGYYNELGQTVIIDHGNGISTVYGHASQLLVKKGQVVEKGSVIAKVGSSGRATGSHLHFEIRINDVQIDPRKYLEK